MLLHNNVLFLEIRILTRKKKSTKQELKRKKQEYLNDFIATLDVDDFQKEIILQTMDSYFDEITKINQLGLKSFERQEYIDRLDASHFKDLKVLVKEDTMTKIMDALKGKWDRNEEKKKKKKKKKNRKN